MTEAMPFLRNTILLSYDTRSFPGENFFDTLIFTSCQIG